MPYLLPRSSSFLRLARWALAAGLLAALPPVQAATGLAWIDANTNLTITADARLRYEVDWDSQTAAGVARDDRHRGRARARLGAGYRFSDAWSAGVRVRTGSSSSQQSPHLTFATDDGTRDSLDFVVDRYFVQFKEGGTTAWAGRNTMPFWQQNELFWDEDVTPTGVAGSWDKKTGKGTLSLVGGAFYLPDGGYVLNGQLLGGQVKFTAPIGKSQFTAASALHYLHGEDGANNLRNRNGARDYLLSVSGVQWSLPVGKLPLSFGADLFKNFEDYSAADTAPLAALNADETLGYVLSVQLGQLKQAGDWLLGYYYAHIETFAVNASYAQDDWARFGNATQSDLTDFEGHEVRLAYAISKNLNAMARLYLVEAITTGQDGKRFRLDLNWRF